MKEGGKWFALRHGSPPPLPPEEESIWLLANSRQTLTINCALKLYKRFCLFSVISVINWRSGTRARDLLTAYGQKKMPRDHFLHIKVVVCGHVRLEYVGVSPRVHFRSLWVASAPTITCPKTKETTKTERQKQKVPKNLIDRLVNCWCDVAAKRHWLNCCRSIRTIEFLKETSFLHPALTFDAIERMRLRSSGTLAHNTLCAFCVACVVEGKGTVARSYLKSVCVGRTMRTVRNRETQSNISWLKFFCFTLTFLLLLLFIFGTIFFCCCCW